MWYAAPLDNVEMNEGATPLEQARESAAIAEREAWQKMYDEAGSAAELGRRLGLTGQTVTYHLHRRGIEVHKKGFKSPKSHVARGADHHNWKGGTYYHADGYVYEYAPDHPDAAKDGFPRDDLGRFIA